ncbi:MAG: terminase large subunit domain-containing protein [Alphaproteobacteria bacterium]
MVSPTLNIPQAKFLNLDKKFRLYVAGFGSGKTWAGSASLSKHFWSHPGVNAGYFAPTYPQIRDIFYETFDEVAYDWGLRADIKESNKEIGVYEGRKYRGTILCRSMEKPTTIVGFKIGKALVDELDVMSADKAQKAWRKIIARMRVKREGLQNGIDVTTTPEGFKFVYKQFVKAVREKPSLSELYGVVQASTYDNAKNLPDDYIASLFESYPPQLISAYLRGQFVNLNSGSVYPNFCRIKNHSNAVMRNNEALHIGMDFNVTNMSATINVIRDGSPITVAEITKVQDTPHMIRVLDERYDGHSVMVYPDASGRSRKTVDASLSDIKLLECAGYKVIANKSNPSIKDRVNSVNAMCENAKGECRWKVNTDQCPQLTECLEQQAYDDNGEPDKSSGHDHLPDAQGYFINKKYPIVRKGIKKVKITGT